MKMNNFSLFKYKKIDSYLNRFYVGEKEQKIKANLKVSKKIYFNKNNIIIEKNIFGKKLYD